MAVISIRRVLSAEEMADHAADALAIAKSKRNPRERQEWFIVAWALAEMAERAALERATVQ